MPVLQVSTGSIDHIGDSRASLENEDTTIDLYTKTVLTVIAAALVGIVAQQAIPGATAQPTSTCRQEANPCAVFMMT
jgi:hypothetical protein